jgi:hypothetical protein
MIRNYLSESINKELLYGHANVLEWLNKNIEINVC